MVIVGFALIVGSSALAQPLLLVAGLVLVIAAYVVPGLMSSRRCPGAACAAPIASPPKSEQKGHPNQDENEQEEKGKDE